MTSSEQIAANRRNAKSSTGPRTAKGTRRARMNALKHGLRARELLTPDENSADYDAYLSGALRDLKPIGFLETELAETIINTRWRLRRCERIEAGLLGGGRHVMAEIESTRVEKFEKMLQPKVETDPTFSQLLQELMQLRINADFSGKPQNDLPFAHVSGEVLAEDYLKAREEERQANPLSYDIALAFKRGLTEQDALAKLTRYEVALHRTLQRTLCEFRRLQAERKAEADKSTTVIDATDLNLKAS